MELRDLAEKVPFLPTIMSVKDELSILNQLRQFSDKEIATNRAEFLFILEHIVGSHEDVYYEVDKSTLPCFLEFASWLRPLGERLGINMGGALSVLTADPTTDPTYRR